MTRIAGTNIIKAPCCGAFFSTVAFASINFMASEHWMMVQRKTLCLSLLEDFADALVAATFSLATPSELDLSQRTLDNSQNDLNTQLQRYSARSANFQINPCFFKEKLEYQIAHYRKKILYA